MRANHATAKFTIAIAALAITVAGIMHSRLDADIDPTEDSSAFVAESGENETACDNKTNVSRRHFSWTSVGNRIVDEWERIAESKKTFLIHQEKVAFPMVAHFGFQTGLPSKNAKLSKINSVKSHCSEIAFSSY